MSNVKARMQALGLLDRSFKATTDEELSTAIEALSDDHRDALREFVGNEPTPAALRDVAAAVASTAGWRALPR